MTVARCTHVLSGWEIIFVPSGGTLLIFRRVRVTGSVIPPII